MLRELNDMEARLDVELTEISPSTIETLDAVLETGPPFVFPHLYVWGMPVGKAANVMADLIYDYMEQRRIRRMASLAPEALKVENIGQRNGPTIAPDDS
jgi:hypothetical protein